MRRPERSDRAGGAAPGKPGGWRGALAARGRAGLVPLLVVVVGAAVLYLVLGRGGEKAGAYPYAVGAPGPGQRPPAVRLASTTGGDFDLGAHRGQTVLLYFQEGLTCQPCWDQLTAIQRDAAAFRRAGIDTIVSITTDPLELIRQKVRDQGITLPVLSDPAARVSDAYDARRYSMDWMRPLRNGHSFVLVGPRGRILWRADYGGTPRYTMFVPTQVLLADIDRPPRA